MLTYYVANSILNCLGGRSGSISFGSNIYVALSQTQPNHSSTGTTDTGVTEPSGGGYKRVLLGSASTSYTQKMTPAVGGVITNGTPESNTGDIIYFPEVIGSEGAEPWGTLYYFCLFDQVSGGHLLAFAPICDEEGHPLSEGITPVVGQLPIIRKGQLRISIDEEEPVPESGE